MTREGRPGFVVPDLTDVDAFGPVDAVELPGGPVYALHGLERGDELRNRSPDEALPDAVAAGREPFLVLGAISGG